VRSWLGFPTRAIAWLTGFHDSSGSRCCSVKEHPTEVIQRLHQKKGLPRVGVAT
jgi:hypothetical protein